MKIKEIIPIILIALLAMLSQANAGEKELSKDKVPKAVLEAFEKAFPNVKAMKFEKENFKGAEAYEVEYKDSGKEYEALYSADGTLLQKEEEIDVKALPETVVNAVKKAHPKGKIKEAEKLMNPDGSLAGFEVEIKTPKGKHELELDVDGQILRTEKD